MENAIRAKLIVIIIISLSFVGGYYLYQSKPDNTKYIFDNKDIFIAHAAGMINHTLYTDSLEALNYSYKKGFRLFELDIIKTSDNKFVAAHDWKSWGKNSSYLGNIPPTHNDFMKYKIFRKYTPLNMEAINLWFSNHKDAQLVTDKVNNPKEFVSQFIDKNRLMMELFSWEAVFEAQKLGIKSAMPTWDIIKIIKGDKFEFIKNHSITDIAASRRIIKNNKQLLNKLKTKGVHVYAFHINKEKGYGEKKILCKYQDYIYGLYANSWDFDSDFICDKNSK